MKILSCIFTALLTAGTVLIFGGGVPSMAADFSTTSTYDDLGRPLSVSVDGSTAGFAYDAAGNRTVVSLSPASTAPSVAVVSPPDNAIGISSQVRVAASFSRPMDPATVTTGTFFLTDMENVAIPGTITIEGLEATFAPTNQLLSSTQYKMTITTGVKDLGGQALAQQKIWTFTTAAAPDLTPPTVLSTTPAQAAADVPLTSAITALFNEALEPATINNDSFLVKNGSYTVAAKVTYDSATRTATLTPDAPLDQGVTYTAVLIASITDTSGNRMTANNVWTFTTVMNGTPVPPAADVLIPSNGQEGLPLRTSIGVIFNKSMSPGTINASTFKLNKGALAITGTVSYNPIKHQATFIPAAALDLESEYTATLTTGITDTTGIPLEHTLSWSFTTAQLPPVNIICTLSGSGTGIIESIPPNFACGPENCSGNFPRNNSVQLHPVPYDTSNFIGWSAPCAGPGDCSFIPDGNTTLTATFDLKPLRILSSMLYFNSLQTAYDSTETNDSIQAKAATTEGDVTTDGARTVTIRGGYDETYTTNGGYATLKGRLTIKGGKIIVDRLAIK